MQGLTRAAVLRCGAGGGLALAVAATPLALLPASATAAPPDGDLAWLRLLVATELLALDFAPRVTTSLNVPQPVRRMFGHILADEKTHWSRLAELMNDAGQTPATSDDIDFTYPAKTFASTGAILRQATKIESLLCGAYIGALAAVATPELRLALAQIAANEAQHASAVARRRGGPEIGPAFTPALGIDAASDALDRYES